MKRFIFPFITVFFILVTNSICCHAQNRTTGGIENIQAKGILLEYLKNDSEGKLLTSDNWPIVQRLTTWEDAGGDELCVIEGYQAVQVDNRGDQVDFLVTFHSLGMENGSGFYPNKKDEILKVTLIEKDGVWKINYPQWGPHVLKINVPIEWRHFLN